MAKTKKTTEAVNTAVPAGYVPTLKKLYKETRLIELYQLEELAAFSDCGTISGVGERLGVSQPAVSRAMRLLEEAFGVPLFNRSSNSVSLNSTGEKAARHARLIVEAVQRAVEDVRAYDRSLNTVLVGSEAPAPLWSVAPLLSPFFPGKVIAGELTDVRTLQEGLGSGRFRMVITTCPVRLSCPCRQPEPLLC